MSKILNEQAVQTAGWGYGDVSFHTCLLRAPNYMVMYPWTGQST